LFGGVENPGGSLKRSLGMAPPCCYAPPECRGAPLWSPKRKKAASVILTALIYRTDVAISCLVCAAIGFTLGATLVVNLAVAAALAEAEVAALAAEVAAGLRAL